MARNVTDEDLDALVARLGPMVKPETPCGECIGPGSIERHKMHHEFIEELIKTMKKWNEVKWFSIKSIAGAIALTLLAGFLIYYFGIPMQKVP